jgi:hypothetical protein
VDASMSKSFRIDENRRVQIRFDATNVLNHPNPCSAGYCPVPFGQSNRGTNLSLNNSNDFGLIGVKSATRARQFQASIRFDFF